MLFLVLSTDPASDLPDSDLMESLCAPNEPGDDQLIIKRYFSKILFNISIVHLGEKDEWQVKVYMGSPI